MVHIIGVTKELNINFVNKLLVINSCSDEEQNILSYIEGIKHVFKRQKNDKFILCCLKISQSILFLTFY